MEKITLENKMSREKILELYLKRLGETAKGLNPDEYSSPVGLVSKAMEVLSNEFAETISLNEFKDLIK